MSLKGIIWGSLSRRRRSRRVGEEIGEEIGEEVGRVGGEKRKKSMGWNMKPDKLENHPNDASGES